MNAEPESNAESLFTAESDLRSAAIAYGVMQNGANRKALRAAAVAYAEAANEVDAAVDEYREQRPRSP